MRDVDKFVELYKGFGIDVIVNKTDNGFEITLSAPTQEGEVPEKGYTCHPNLLYGFHDFYTVVKFDDNGKFLGQGFYE